MNNLKKMLFEPLRLKGKDDEFLFWGCTHFDHNPKWEDPIYKQRGYESAEDCTIGLINNWNSKASHNTVSFLLGDVMFGMGGFEKFLSLLNRLNFKDLYLCSGNHCAGYKQALELTDDNAAYQFSSEKKLIFVPNYFEAFVNGQPIVMSHYPILSWNGQAKGSWMLFSHVHGNLEKSKIGSAYLASGGKMYEVSVEKNAYPITFGEIRKIMREREDVSFDHHSRETQNPF